MVSSEHSNHALTASQRDSLFRELDEASERMKRIQSLVSAVYGDDSQETSRAVQTVHAIFRLKRELARGDAQRTMSATA